MKGGQTMLSKHEAKKIGIRACIDKLGYEFCREKTTITIERI